MTYWLEKILIWAAARLPDSQAVWIEDLRHEAQHIPAGMRRIYFLWGGVQAAIGEILRVSVGPRRLGQALLGFALISFSLAVIIFAMRVHEPAAQFTIYGACVLYIIAGVLTVLDLRLLKRFTLCVCLCLGLVSLSLGLPYFAAMDIPLAFLRAFTFEASGIMFGLFIAASYLAWVENPDHA